MAINQNPVLRILRVFLVVAPILSLGFILGTGRLQQALRTHLTPITLTPPTAPDLRVVDQAGNPRPQTGKTASVRMNLGEQLIFDGGKLAKVKMATTRLPLARAIQDYDAKFRTQGWILDPDITRSIRDFSRKSCLRFFKKNGRLRLLIIGPGTGTGKSQERPVTVFEGRFRNDSSK